MTVVILAFALCVSILLGIALVLLNGELLRMNRVLRDRNQRLMQHLTSRRRSSYGRTACSEADKVDH